MSSQKYIYKYLARLCLARLYLARLYLARLLKGSGKRLRSDTALTYCQHVGSCPGWHVLCSPCHSHMDQGGDASQQRGVMPVGITPCNSGHLSTPDWVVLWACTQPTLGSVTVALRPCHFFNHQAIKTQAVHKVHDGVHRTLEGRGGWGEGLGTQKAGREGWREGGGSVCCWREESRGKDA